MDDLFRTGPAYPHTSPMTDRVRLSLTQTILVGSLIFGLFFGAGNLIFPAGLGRDAGSSVTIATIGFLITAVGLPIVGLIASALARATTLVELLTPVARWYAIAYTCALYLTIGPLFAIPRTATVSYEIGIAPLLSQGMQTMGLIVFTLVFFGVTGLAALRPGKLLDYVGRYLTPIFLVLLAGLIVAAIVKPMSHDLAAPVKEYASAPLAKGLLDGYNTMDALASLAFAIVVIEAIRRLGVNDPGRIAATVAKSGVVAVIGMSVIYGALAYIGATSIGAMAQAKNGGAILAGVSAHYYGGAGQLLIAAIVLVACLKTAIGLVTACAEMFATMFPKSLSHRAWAMLFTVVSLVIANFGLEAIMALSVPVLMFLYPLAITAIILGLLTPVIRGRRWPHRLMTAFVAVAAFFDLVNALPEGTPGHQGLVDMATAILPGFSLGFGWVVPGLIGLVLGLIIMAVTKEPIPAPAAVDPEPVNTPA